MLDFNTALVSDRFYLLSQLCPNTFDLIILVIAYFFVVQYVLYKPLLFTCTFFIERHYFIKLVDVSHAVANLS